MKHLLKISLFIFAVTASVSLFGQCRSFAKKYCTKPLKPYINNGQMNNALMFPGETAGAMITAYSGQNYRLLICYQDFLLGNGVYFDVKDESGKLLYSNKDSELFYWDFKVESTQNLIIEVHTPQQEDGNSEIDQNGCVSILLGFLGDD